METNKETIRVFFSIHVPEEVSVKFFHTAGAHVPILWYPKENMHITLQFIGNVTPAECEELFVVGDVASAHAGAISIIPEKFFIADRRLRLGIVRSPELNQLRENILLCLRKIGIGLQKIDNKLYGPHITLGRHSVEFDISSLGNPSLFAFTAKDFGLYKSEPGENNLGQYILLKKFALK